MKLLLFYIFFFALAKPIFAQTSLLEDTFDRNGLGKWEVVRNTQYYHPDRPCFYQGFPTHWEIVDGRLGIKIDGAPCTTEIIPTHLDLTAVTDYEFEFDWLLAESTHMDRNVLVQWQDKDNWIGLHLFDNKIIVQKVMDGKTADLYENSTHYEFKANQSYHFKIAYLSDEVVIWIDDELILEVLDRPPFMKDFKTVGFQASVGDVFQSATWFDNMVVNSLDEVGEKKLAVPLYKQHDSRWANQEYDSAKDWSRKSTIQRWGCALTSMVMILQYHGISQLPDGTNLNPATLNVWLNDQKDGYIGEGLLNWMAVTRMTHQVSKKNEGKTPALEYKRIAGKKENAIKELKKDKPVILQLPGHFLVASGYNQDQTDLFIKDPAYNYNLFSQHEKDKKKLQSVTTFTPSHTDLSYLLIVHDPAIEVAVTNTALQPLPDLQTYAEFIDDAELTSSAQTKVKIIHELPQPGNGEYLIRINGNVSNEILDDLVKIYTYDVDGEVTIFQPAVTQETQLFELSFDQHQPSPIQTVTNIFTLFRAKLQGYYQHQKIMTRYAYLKLDQLASWAEKVDDEDENKDEDEQKRYQQLINTNINELQEFISKSDDIINDLILK